MAEIASAPALASCRASSPSLPIPSISYMEDLWSSHNLATAYHYLLISSYIFTIASRQQHTCTPPAHCVYQQQNIAYCILHSALPCCISLTSPFSCQLYCTHPAAVKVLTSQLLTIAPSVADCRRMHASCWTTAFTSLPLPVAGHCICIIAPASCWPLYLHCHHPSCLLLLLHHDACLSVASHCIYIISASCWSLHYHPTICWPHHHDSSQLLATLHLNHHPTSCWPSAFASSLLPVLLYHQSPVSSHGIAPSQWPVTNRCIAPS